MEAVDKRLAALSSRAAAREKQYQDQLTALANKRLDLEAKRARLEKADIAQMAHSADQRIKTNNKIAQTESRINELIAKRTELDMRATDARNNSARKQTKIDGTSRNLAAKGEVLETRKVKLDFDLEKAGREVDRLFDRVEANFIRMRGALDRDKGQSASAFLAFDKADKAAEAVEELVEGTERYKKVLASINAMPDEDKRNAALSRWSEIAEKATRIQIARNAALDKWTASNDAVTIAEKALADAEAARSKQGQQRTDAQIRAEQMLLNLVKEEVNIGMRATEIEVAGERARQNKLSALALEARQLRDIAAARQRVDDLLSARRGDKAAYQSGLNNIDAKDVKAATEYNEAIAKLDREIATLIPQADRLEAEYKAAMDAIAHHTKLAENEFDKFNKKAGKASGDSAFAGGVKKGTSQAFERVFGVPFSTLKDVITSPAKLLAGLGAGIGFMGTGLIFKMFTAPFKLATLAAGSFFKVMNSGVGQMKQWIGQAHAWNMEILQFSVQTGVAVKDASEFVSVFKVLGLNTMFTSIGIGGLSKEIAANNKYLTSMGIATRDANGALRSTADVIKDLRTQYHSLNEEGKRGFLSNINNVLPFASTLLPMITMDPKIIDSLREMNVILDETEQRDMNRVSASISALQMTGQGLANTFATAVSPAISDFANIIIDLVQRHMGSIQNFFRMISDNVQDLLFMLGLFDQMTDRIGGFSDAMTLGAESGAGMMDPYAESINQTDAALKTLRESVDDTNALMEDQQDIVDELRDSMEGELEVINDLKEGVKDALEAQMKPLEDSIKLLEERKEKWEEDKEAASRAIDAEIGLLELQNQIIERNMQNATRPLRSRLTSLNQQKDALDKDNGTKALKDQIDAIKKASEATDRALRNSSKGAKDALQAQIKAIQRAQDEYERGLEDQKKLLEDQITAIEAVSDAAEAAAKEQEYWDRRAYLMGQSLLAQAEARARALNDRQSRSRQDGESDIDYQLRMMQLSEANNIDNLQRQEELAGLERQRSLDLLNAAREAQINLIKDEIDEIERLADLRKAADDAAIDAIQQQIDLIEQREQAASDAAAARKEAEDDAIAALEAQIDAIEEISDAQQQAIEDQITAVEDQIEAAENAAEAQVDANEAVLESWKRLKQAKEDYYTYYAGNPEAEGLANQKIAKEQELLEVNKQIAAGVAGGSDVESLRSRANSIANEIAALEARLITMQSGGVVGGTSLIDKQIDDINKIKDAQKEAADLRLEQLDDEAEKIRDIYEPQIEAIQEIIEGYQDQTKEIQAKIKEMEREKAYAEELRVAESARIQNTKKELGELEESLRKANTIGGRLGTTLRHIFIDPFSSPKQRALEDAESDYRIANQGNPDAVPFSQSPVAMIIQNNPFLSDEKPSLGKAIGEMLDRSWYEIKPYMEKFGELMGQAIIKGMGMALSSGGKALLGKFDPTDKNSWWYRFPGTANNDSWMDAIFGGVTNYSAPSRLFAGLAGVMAGNAKGDFVSTPTMSMLAEGGFPEAVISTDPKYANRSRAILRTFFAKANETGATPGILGMDKSISGLHGSGRSVAGIDARMGGSLAALGATTGGDTYNFSVGDIYANTKEDSEAISQAITGEFRKFIDSLPAHAKAMELQKVR